MFIVTLSLFNFYTAYHFIFGNQVVIFQAAYHVAALQSIKPCTYRSRSSVYIKHENIGKVISGTIASLLVHGDCKKYYQVLLLQMEGTEFGIKSLPKLPWFKNCFLPIRALLPVEH